MMLVFHSFGKGVLALAHFVVLLRHSSHLLPADEDVFGHHVGIILLSVRDLRNSD